jgi:hypothetical protein
MPLEQTGTCAVFKETAFCRQQSTVRNPDVRTKDKDFLFVISIQEIVVATKS